MNVQTIREREDGGGGRAEEAEALYEAEGASGGRDGGGGRAELKQGTRWSREREREREREVY